MDFAQAGLLIAGTFALTELFKRVWPTAPDAVTQGVTFLFGIAITFLVAYSTYAHGVTVGGVHLDDVNVPGLLLIGILLGGGSTVVHQTLGAVKNVGENQPAAPAAPAPTVMADPLDGFVTADVPADLSGDTSS